MQHVPIVMQFTSQNDGATASLFLNAENTIDWPEPASINMRNAT